MELRQLTSEKRHQSVKSDEDEVVDNCHRCVDGDFRVKGSGEFVDYEQWQSRKLWLRHRRSSGDVFSFPDLVSGKSVVQLWDNLDLGFESFDLLTGTSPSMVVSAAGGDSRSIEVKVWDRCLSCRVLTILTEWRAQPREIVRHNVYGFEKIFVVGDNRKAGAALDNVTWWDADAVNLTDGVGRRCDAVKPHLLLGNDE